MLTAEHYPKPFAEVSLQKRDLLEIHRSKISLDRAKKVTAIQRYAFPSRSQGL